MVGDQGFIARKGCGSARSSHLHGERYLLPCLPSEGDLGYLAIRHHRLLYTRSDLSLPGWNIWQVRDQVRWEPRKKREAGDSGLESVKPSKVSSPYRYSCSITGVECRRRFAAVELCVPELPRCTGGADTCTHAIERVGER
jgi:hypothetical protein